MTTLLRGFHISSLAWVGDFMAILEPYAALKLILSNHRLENNLKCIKIPYKKKCCGIKALQRNGG